MSAITLISNEFKAEMLQVNHLILAAASSANEIIVNNVVSHISKAGGKRLRPLLTLLCARIFDSCNQNAIKLAAAVEFIHTATLLHDDVIDKGIIRRGLKTANEIWGDKTSILVGDYLFSQAFKLIVETKSILALEYLADASSLISKAEVAQLRLIGAIEITIAEYIKLITEKTAVLFATACQVGGIAMEVDQNYISVLYRYGLNFGIIFQIVDDYLDYFGDELVLGKSIGGDFLENKITLPVILLYCRCNNEEKNFLRRVFNINYQKNHVDLESLIDLLKKYNIDSKIKVLVDEYLVLCVKSLQILPNNEFVNYLKLLAHDYFVGTK